MFDSIKFKILLGHWKVDIIINVCCFPISSLRLRAEWIKDTENKSFLSHSNQEDLKVLNIQKLWKIKNFPFHSKQEVLKFRKNFCLSKIGNF
ncbi:MAG: hypothetical protein WC584_02085 [Candidatus Pacearchaeota archaeon]